MKRNLFRMFAAAGILGLYTACSDNSTVAPKPGLAPGAAPAFDFAVPGNGTGACMGDDGVTADGLVSGWISGNPTAAQIGCTSNDISIAQATVIGYSFISATGPFTPLPAGEHISCTPGQTIFAQTSALLKNSAQDRYNIGVWVADDDDVGVEGSAVTGKCLHFNLIPGVHGSSQKDGDSCGDMNQGAGLASVDLGTLNIVCPAGQAQVTVNNCVGWENSNLVSARGNCPNVDPANTGSPQISNAQAFRDGTLPETKSKCNCAPFTLPIDVRGQITIVKNTVGGDGSFDFTSDVGSNSTPVVTSPFTITTTNNTGSQLIDQVASGTYHIAESTPPSDFNFTSLSCTAANAFASATVSGQTATITMGKGGLITCTYTNTKKSLLTLVKTVTNDGGGTKTTSDFALTASGPLTITGTTGATAVTNRVVDPGTYTLTEQTQAGYTASSWTCSGGTQSGTNSIALATGNSATCTINNNDNAPILTLVKVVTNNAGGTKTTSDFALTASGPVTISGTTGAASVTNRPVTAGQYTLTEQTQAGYTPSSWTCSGGTQSGTNSISIGLAGAATCTITNDDIAPTLTLVKVVTNNDGGTKTISDFALTASGPVTISGTSGATSVTNRPVSAGQYTLTEQTQAGYSASSWTCSGGTQSGTNSISLGLAGAATCTISNDDVAATLTLVKVVTNNAGGTKTTSDFALTASGPATISGTTGATAVTNRPVSAGQYTLTEQTQTGYTASSWTCSGGTQSGTNSISLGLAGAATCTISNDDIGASLTLVKVVTNNDGGTKTMSDFALTASGPVTISGTTGATSVTNRPVNAGQYTLTEQTQAGYSASSWTCSGGTQSGTNSISLGLAGAATCTISNDDVAATLTLVKVVTNNAGGTKTTSDFALTASGPATISGTTGATAVTNRPVSAGQYTLTEQTQTGYTASSWTCSGGTQSGTNSISLGLAGAATCTISNDDIGASLTLVKVVTNNDGGTRTTSDFALTASGPVTISGTTGATSVTNRPVSAGQYTLTEQTQAGYTASSWTCSGGTQAGTNSISLALAGAATCTIVNDDQPASLTLVKVVTNNNGGTKTTSDFALTASGPVTISGTTGATSVTNRSVSAGQYTLTEQTQAGYTPSSWTCSGGTQAGTNSISVALAGAATCTISNDDIGPSLTLVKVVTNDNGGTKTTSDFALTASGPVTISGTTGATAVTNRVVNAGSYTLTEQTQTGYTASSWTCSGGTQSGTNSIALALAGAATCTINNNDNPPALSIVKTPDQLGDAGYTVQAPGTATFTITVSNSSAAGTGTALGVTLTDTLPANLTWSADNGCSTSGSVTPPKPPGDGLTHQVLSCNIGTLAPGGSFVVHVSASVPSSFVQQPPSPAGSPIEIDGDLDDGATAGKDWASLTSAMFSCLSSPKVGCDLDKPTGTTDDSFGQGTKEDTPSPTVVSGSIPNNKSDLQRFYVSTERFVTNDFLYLGWERVQAPNGTTNMDFELNQSSVKSANGVTPVRTAGDILIKYDLAKGGTTPVLGFHRWVTSGVPSTVCEASNTVPCWGKGTTILSGALAAVNTGSVTDPILASGQVGSRTLDALTFGEASIDLQTAGIFQAGACVSFGQAYLKSRSSTSFTSEIKDFIAPIPVSVTNCAPVILNNTAWVSATNVSGSTSDGGQINVTTPPRERSYLSGSRGMGVRGGASNDAPPRSALNAR